MSKLQNSSTATAPTAARASSTRCPRTACARPSEPTTLSRGSTETCVWMASRSSLSFIGQVPFIWAKGRRFLIIDERASGPQREALARLLTGEDTEPGKTVWNVFASTVEQSYDTIFKKIDLSIDVDARRANLTVDGVGTAKAEPIRNPVTGAEHRARIDLPDGFEYTIAEMGSGSIEHVRPHSAQARGDLCAAGAHPSEPERHRPLARRQGRPDVRDDAYRTHRAPRAVCYRGMGLAVMTALAWYLRAHRGRHRHEHHRHDDVAVPAAAPGHDDGGRLERGLLADHASHVVGHDDRHDDPQRHADDPSLCARVPAGAGARPDRRRRWCRRHRLRRATSSAGSASARWRPRCSSRWSRSASCTACGCGRPAAG